MTCRELMTAHPSCCVKSDTAAQAARIMKSEDVGPVPVVEDSDSRRLAGIVTDRDLALKVVAEGRDPQSVRLEEIMSREVVTCAPESEAHEAMRKMSDHQVRRIPVVDEEDRLVGIIAQADVARHMHEAQVGDVVEDISEPTGTRARSFGGLRRTEWSRPEQGMGAAASGLVTGLLGLGIGAGLMYILDPNTGRRRRAVARDKATSVYRQTGETIRDKARDLGNRAQGLVSEARSKSEEGRVAADAWLDEGGR